MFEVLEERRLLAAVRVLPGFQTNTLPRGDDVSVGPVPLPFEINFFGEMRDELFVNTNGNVTFGSAFAETVPFESEGGDARLYNFQQSIIAPFWADVDTTDPMKGAITYGTAMIGGRMAFGVNWVNVAFEAINANLTNSFQMVLIDRSDIAPNAFDLEFNYDSINWDTGLGSMSASSGASARAGFSSSNAVAGNYYELIGSGVDGAFFNSNNLTGLNSHSLLNSELGRYLFEFRDGTALDDLGLAGQRVQVSPGITALGAGIHPDDLHFVQPTNVDAANTTNTDQIQPGGSANLNLTGAGLTVGVWEAGGRNAYIRTTHQELTGRVTIIDHAAPIFSDHATHVAGTIAASGVDPSARGMATQVQIRSYNDANDTAEMQADAALIVASNHSYGFDQGWSRRARITGFPAGADTWLADRSTLATEDGDFGKYTTYSQAVDQVLFANRNLLTMWAAGNERDDVFSNALGTNQYVTWLSAGPSGAMWYLVNNTGATSAPPQDGNAGAGFDSVTNGGPTSKNAVVVGAIRDVTIDPYPPLGIANMTAFSSWGPTDDGRVKPDVVGNGFELRSSVSSADNAYQSVGWSGTSMATPNVTGTAVLLIQHFNNLFGTAPRSATSKGILIHNAFDAGNVGPDYTFGWGLVDAAASAEFISHARNPVAGETNQILERVLNNGTQATFTVNVTSGTPLKATLVWTDPPGTPQPAGVDAPNRVLVNDLDLTVIGPNGTFLPWTLDRLNPANPASRNARNNLDNVEQVLIDAPQSGTYTIRVSHTGGLQAGNPQQFTLLISGREIAPDAFEENDTLATATVLGSLPQITLRDLTIDSETDVDFFKYTAHSTGKLIVRALFTHADGDLELRVRDSSGDIIASSTGVVDNEELVIPVVTQQTYFVEVFGAAGAANLYDLEIENFPTPVPTGVHLDPADDTGMMNNDNITSETRPQFFIQTDVLEFVDSNGDGMANDEIAVLTAAQAAAGNVPGIGVEVTLVNTTLGTSITGFASPLIALMPEVYTFTPSAALTPGVYLVTARTKIFDLRQNPPGTPAPAMGRSNASPPLWITIDTGAAAANMVSADLINSSDTGMLNNDNVTNKMQPAFNGMAPAGSKVRLYVIPNGETVRDLVGQTVAGSDTSDVGRGPIGGIGGAGNDGLGLWEITVEPLESNGYDLRLEIEDAAGNVTQVNPVFNPAAPAAAIDFVVDTVEPNTPFLDLITLDDSGRNNTDNVTKVNTPRVTMTSSDPNIDLAKLLFTDNLKFRIFDRFTGVPEFLLYDSALNSALANEAFEMDNPADVFTALTFIMQTLPAQFAANPLPNSNGAVLPTGVLADGIHNLKLEVEDRAGNISHDFLFSLTIDTKSPLVSFGQPDSVNTTDGLLSSSDTGVVTTPSTFADRVTSDTTPTFWGRAEANTVVRVFFDVNGDGVINLLTDTFLGQTVALPYDGNDGFVDGSGNPLGTWVITSVLDLNQIAALPKDGVRRLLVTAEDVAGNPMPVANAITDVDDLQIFIDTQGPQVTSVFVTSTPTYNLFDPKPSTSGFTPLVTSLSINIRDLPNRVDQAGTINDFLYEALQPDVALAPGNYLLVGDHVGTIAIQSIQVVNYPRTNGNPATATVQLTFFEPLPDDRYTLTIRDNLVDPAGNKLDGESHAVQPLGSPSFPSGDGVPGGNFAARFTIDSRPEIGNYVPMHISIDINGNFFWDPSGQPVAGDNTNVDLSFTLPVQNANGTIGAGGGNVHDLLFVGKFFQPNGTATRRFDQLAAFGFSNQLGIYRWIIDTNSDGVVTLGTDIFTQQPTLGSIFNVAGAIPVAGNFDNNGSNGDEIGLYNAGKWYLDTNRSFVIGDAGDTLITTNLLGHPIVGNFDGDLNPDGSPKDDLAVFNNNVFSFNLANDGFADPTDATMIWGFPGVLDRPIAADMDQDGIDDLGLWVPRSDASLPQGVAQWYFLVSNDFASPGVPAAHAAGSIAKINHAFTTKPFGKDIFTEFGDQLSLPIVGNFDPPTAAAPVGGSSLAGDYDNNGRVDNADRAVWMSSYGSTTNLSADGNRNGVIDSGDYIVWRNNMGAVAASSAGALPNSVSAAISVASTVGPTSVAPEPIDAAPSASQIAAPDVSPVTPRGAGTAAKARTISAGERTVDDFFARYDKPVVERRTSLALSATSPLWENDELLLMLRAAGPRGLAMAGVALFADDEQQGDDGLLEDAPRDADDLCAVFDLL